MRINIPDAWNKVPDKIATKAGWVFFNKPSPTTSPEFYKAGGIAFMLLYQGFTPAGVKPEYASLSTPKLKRALAKEMLRRGYKFSLPQSEEAAALLQEIRAELNPPPPVFEQEVTVTVVLKRTALDNDSVIAAREYVDGVMPVHKAVIPDGSNTLAEMLADGFSVREVQSVRHKDSRPYAYGWRRIEHD